MIGCVYIDTNIDIHIYTYAILKDVKLRQIANFRFKATCFTSKSIYIKFTDNLGRFEHDTIYIHRYTHT